MSMRHLNLKNAAFRIWVVLTILWECYIVYGSVHHGKISFYIIWVAMWPIVFPVVFILLIKVGLWVLDGFRTEMSPGYGIVERLWCFLSYENMHRILVTKYKSVIKIIATVLLFLVAALSLMFFIAVADIVSLKELISNAQQDTLSNDPWDSFSDVISRSSGLEPSALRKPSQPVATEDPYAAFPDAPAALQPQLKDDPYAAFPDAPSSLPPPPPGFVLDDAVPQPVNVPKNTKSPFRLSFYAAMLVGIGGYALFRRIVLSKKSTFLFRSFGLILVSIVLDRLLYSMRINQLYPYLSLTSISMLVLLFMWTRNRNLKKYSSDNGATDIMHAYKESGK